MTRMTTVEDGHDADESIGSAIGNWAMGCGMQIAMLVLVGIVLSADLVTTWVAVALMLGVPMLVARCILVAIGIRSSWVHRLIGPACLLASLAIASVPAVRNRRELPSTAATAGAEEV